MASKIDPLELSATPPGDRGLAVSLGQLRNLILVGFLVRILAGLFLPEIIIFDDEKKFHVRGFQIQSNFAIQLAIPWLHDGWAVATGVIYYLFTPDPVVIKIFNSILGCLTALVVTAGIHRLYGDLRLTRRVFLVLLFLPPIIFISAIALKAQAIALGLALVFYAVVVRGFAGTIYGIAGILIIFWLRNANLLVIFAAGLGSMITVLMSVRQISVGLRVIVVGGIVLGTGAASQMVKNVPAFQQSKVGQVLLGLDQRSYDTIRFGKAEVNKYLDRDNLLSPSNIVIPPARALFSPSPVRGIKVDDMTIFALEGLIRSLFWYLAVPFAFIGMVAGGRGYAHTFFSLLIAGVFLSSAYSVLTFAPEFERYRWAVFPLLFAMAVVGYDRVHGPLRRLALAGWWGSAAIFHVFYLIG